MIQEKNLPSDDAIDRYCASCHIPPLLIPELAKKVKLTLEGKESTIHDTESLRRRLAELKRFPKHFNYNQRLRMNYQDYIGVHQERIYGW